MSRHDRRPSRLRRRAVLAAAASLALRGPTIARAQPAGHPQRRWVELARRQRERAEAWGDQSYGAVVVLGEQVVGLGPSRVVIDRDPDAHAERVAIRAAQQALGTPRLDGALLYSTSRPCRVCEAAAARAGIVRMFHGPMPDDAGAPRD